MNEGGRRCMSERGEKEGGRKVGKVGKEIGRK
jgi:hypothetical protein